MDRASVTIPCFKQWAAGRGPGSSAQEIPQKIVAMGGQNRFGMKLDTFNVEFAMAYPHDFLHIPGFVRSPRCHLKAIWKAGLINHQRMVTGRFKWVGKTLEYRDVAVVNH